MTNGENECSVEFYDICVFFFCFLHVFWTNLMVLCRSENVIWIEYKFWIVNIMDFGETKFHWFSMNAAVYLPTHCFNLFCLFCLSFYYLLSLHSHLELDYSTEKCFMLKFKLILVYHSDFARWLWVSGSNVKFIDTHSERRLLSTVCVSTQYIYILICVSDEGRRLRGNPSRLCYYLRTIYQVFWARLEEHSNFACENLTNISLGR